LPPTTAPARYGFGWIWDRACFNPVTGVVAGGGGGSYYYGRRLQEETATPAVAEAAAAADPDGLEESPAMHHLLQQEDPDAENQDTSSGTTSSPAAGHPEGNNHSRQLLQQSSARRPGAWSRAGPNRDAPSVLNVPPAASAPGAASSTYGGGAPSTTTNSNSRQVFTPNKVYSATAGAVAYTVRTQAPRGSKVVVPPPTEAAAAAALNPTQITAAQAAVAAAAAGKAANGTWQEALKAAGSVSPAGLEAGTWRDVYMSQAYYNPAYAVWSIDFSCRVKADWNVRNTVTLLATVVKAGVITHGSAAGEQAAPLGLAYPQVAVRGGTMLVTFTYSSYANVPKVPGAENTGVPAFPGGWFRGVGAACESSDRSSVCLLFFNPTSPPQLQPSVPLRIHPYPPKASASPSSAPRRSPPPSPSRTSRRRPTAPCCSPGGASAITRGSTSTRFRGGSGAPTRACGRPTRPLTTARS
jgi:hypothetical protein